MVLLSLISDTLESRQDKQENEMDKIKILLSSEEEYDGDNDQSDDDVESVKVSKSLKN